MGGYVVKDVVNRPGVLECRIVTVRREWVCDVCVLLVYTISTRTMVHLQVSTKVPMQCRR